MKIINGDSLEVLKRATANSIDAVVCDPPYFLINSNGSGFMNKDWDGIMGLWKYQWNDKAFVDFVISLLKSCRVEDNMVGVNTVQEIANTQVEEKTTENNVNSVRENSNTQTKSKGSAQVIVLTRQGLLDLLSGELSVLTKLNQFLNGEKENAVYVIPVISLQSERKAIVQKSVTTLRKAIGLQEIKITFTKTDLQKKRDSIEAIIGESSENLFTKGMGGSVDIVDSIVVREKSNATTSHHTDSQETMASITLLLCAYFATRKSSEIQKDLIKTFFRVIFLEVSRVLKPGGHVLAFAGSRTYQWLATGIEDAGFDIRDMIMYVYGSGFPKSHNIGKSVDKLQGNEREVTGTRQVPDQRGGGISSERTIETGGVKTRETTDTKGSSPYEGWGTALKPAHEPIVVARKPLSEKTIAKNVLEWGTGGINIDGCRVGTEQLENKYCSKKEGYMSDEKGASGGAFNKDGSNPVQGRFPANFIHDGSDEVVGLFPDSGGGKRVIGGTPRKTEGHVATGSPDRSSAVMNINDSGSAARFFYCAKASKKDRNEGMTTEEQPKKSFNTREEVDGVKKGMGSDRTTAYKNTHPTVKPTALMQYLVRLVTPVGGTVLDPFMGSGSTGKACVLEGFDFIGIELDTEYCKIAQARIKYK
jgi:site-specific DNA-methyltransferase (adenine-specific)